MLQESANTATGPTTSQCPMSKINSVGDNILDYIRKKLLKKYPGKKPLRAFHAKCIGLVTAQIRALDDLPAELKAGLFRDTKTYNAWIRFSNGSGKISADADKGTRGMAIKILNVESNEFVDPDPEGKTQDIILFTSRTHLPDTVGKQVAVPRVVLGNTLEFLGGVIRGLPKRLSSLKVFRKGQLKTPNILEEAYFSATPYAFGEKKIKWEAWPLKTITSSMPIKPGNNFLTERLIKDLSKDAKEDITFGLFVRFHENDVTEPIEDPSVEWKTKAHKVAIITIPKQTGIDTEERALKDINMYFSPGHAIPEHAPLGGVNMIRRKVYGELGEERRRHP
jgi:hypothetical protein